LVNNEFDGILGFGPGFGPHRLFLISQRHSIGLAPWVFTICMDNSIFGGIFSLGEAVNPRLVYTHTIAISIVILHIAILVFY
jgi:hypothetical protein